jgi:hypothetical protein
MIEYERDLRVGQYPCPGSLDDEDAETHLVSYIVDGTGRCEDHQPVVDVPVLSASTPPTYPCRRCGGPVTHDNGVALTRVSDGRVLANAHRFPGRCGAEQ